jgi:hypothetical protein
LISRVFLQRQVFCLGQQGGSALGLSLVQMQIGQIDQAGEHIFEQVALARRVETG